jgi:hypothetical protein
MPVTKQSTVAYTLTSITVNMVEGYLKCLFTRFLDGVETGGLDMRVEGAEMLVLLGAPTTAGKTVGNDITDVVYAYAISIGLIDGAIS